MPFFRHCIGKVFKAALVQIYDAFGIYCYPAVKKNIDSVLIRKVKTKIIFPNAGEYFLLGKKFAHFFNIHKHYAGIDIMLGFTKREPKTVPFVNKAVKVLGSDYKITAEVRRVE